MLGVPQEMDSSEFVAPVELGLGGFKRWIELATSRMDEKLKRESKTCSISYEWILVIVTVGHIL